MACQAKMSHSHTNDLLLIYQRFILTCFHYFTYFVVPISTFSKCKAVFLCTSKDLVNKHDYNFVVPQPQKRYIRENADL